MKKLILFNVIILLFLFTNTKHTNAQANTALKIGTVDVEVIVKGMPDAIEADKKLKDLTQKYRDSLMSIQQDYIKKREQFDKQKAMMPADKQKTEEETLKAMEMQYMQFQEEKFGNQGELAVLREQYLDPIRSRVKTAISTVAKEEKMSFVLDKGGSTVLFSEDKYDITYKVLDKLKRGEGK